MNQPGRRILAGLVLAGLAIYFLTESREKNPRPIPETASSNRSPDSDNAKAAVYALYEAAAKGDIDAYLRGFTGPKRAELDALFQERGRDAFAAALRDLNRAIKGIAIYDVSQPQEDRITLTCELVFIDHNEKQAITLEKTRTRWHIVELTGGGFLKMDTPYGSPVAPAPPENES